MNAKELTPNRSSAGPRSGFVVDGYQRALDGIEATIRPEIELKYAAELKAAGLVKRWLLARRIDKEVKDLVAERSSHISPYSLF